MSAASPLLPLAQIRHEDFAQRLALGESPADAYQAIYSVTPAAARRRGRQLAARPDIAARLHALREQASSADPLPVSLRLRFLADIVLTPLSRVTADHALCELARPTTLGLEHRMPSKLRAIEVYTKIAEKAAPRSKLSPEIAAITDFVSGIRTGKILPPLRETEEEEA